MPEPVVAIRGLRVRRGTASVFDGFDVELPRGGITGLLGPSGSGKSTLMRAIVGVQKLDGGTVSVLGHPAGVRALRGAVAYATQSAAVYDDLTVTQNLRYFARVLGLGRTDVERVMEQVGLASRARRLVGSLSGGERGRVSLAVAMLGAPKLLVLDEPTVGLDPVLRADLWDIFRGLASSGATLIVSSHVMDEALRCDRLLLLRDGELLADTTPAGLLAETGTNNPDDAFLALIRRASGGGR